MELVRKSFAATGLFAVFSISSIANAALVERLGGLAYYDTEANLTWLTDANYAKTSGYDADGRMTWQQANVWAAQLDIDGVAGADGWQLADTLQPDASCGNQNSSSSYGYNCTGSEMGNLFYNVLGNTADSLSNTGPFSNVQTDYVYWSVTEYAPSTGYAWTFDMSNGNQGSAIKIGNRYAWAVQSGDVSAVPVPTAAWLFGSGLIGLIGLARPKSSY